MFTFQRDVFQVLEGDTFGPKVGKSPVKFSKGFIYISKREENTYDFMFSKVNVLRKREGRAIFPPIFNRENEVS